ncbi:MAG: family 10 glycosylhydrolase, partial [Bacteroidales bacterium]
MKKLLPFVLILLLISTQSFTQEPDRELRAVWLTSVYNIDWPHSTNVSPANQQNRLRDILNRLQETNINAVLFQVRPTADALYQS